MHIHTVMITGCGEFPIDMLRYDLAWPATETDSGLIHRNLEGAPGSFCIAVQRASLRKRQGRWTEGRWKSFSCQIRAVNCVADVDRFRKQCEKDKVTYVDGQLSESAVPQDVELK